MSETVTVDIEQVGQLGQGVGRGVDGFVYFVPGALPGDRVRVLPNGPPGKRYREAEVVELVTPSPDRIAPACAHFQDCGGCDWLHWRYEAQLRAKEAMLDRMLLRAQLPAEARRPILAADPPLAYRTRIQLRREGDRTGFFRRRSNDLVDIERCAIAHPMLNEELTRLRAEPAPPERHKIELYVDDEGRVGRVLDAAHGAQGFSQIHTAQNLQLQNTVAEAIRTTEAERVLELFCGDGNLTFAYLPLVKKTVAVDANEPALERARVRREAVEAAPPYKAAFLTARVDRRLPGKLPPDFRLGYDTLLLDPPRTGIGPTLRAFLHENVRTILYVSCLPATFSADVQCLKKEFQLRELVPLDMFPQTRHVEFVATFVRRSVS